MDLAALYDMWSRNDAYLAVFSFEGVFAYHIIRSSLSLPTFCPIDALVVLAIYAREKGSKMVGIQV